MDDEKIEGEEEGIIYMITNIVNSKIYIGKTKKRYGNAKFGIEKRFKAHISQALSDTDKNRDKCTRLARAIRKYGKESFNIKVLFDCDLSIVDDFEIMAIESFDSANPDKGYNIALGGKGRSVVHVSEETRQRMSNTLNKNGACLNIRPFHRGDKLVGYTIKRWERRKEIKKFFTSTDNTPEENFELAKKWLANHIAGIDQSDQFYNKASKLPLYIMYTRHKKTKEINGYRVNFKHKDKKYYAEFTAKSESMEEKLEKAIEFKESILGPE
jgi:group I intron endonuclease